MGEGVGENKIKRKLLIDLFEGYYFFVNFIIEILLIFLFYLVY